MPLNNPTSNASSTSEYQVSGVPYVTSSAADEVKDAPFQFKFPNVTQWISVFNMDTTKHLRVGFSSNGVKGQETKNYIILEKYTETGTRHKIENVRVRTKEIWFQCEHSDGAGFQIIAGLTTVNSGSFPALTGSDGLIGVG